MIMIRSTNTSKLNIKRRKRAGEKAGSVFFGRKSNTEQKRESTRKESNQKQLNETSRNLEKISS
jgi:hypothetical protein